MLSVERYERHGSKLQKALEAAYRQRYLSGIKQKIESYSWQYLELYTKCCDQLEAYFSSSIQSTLLKGLRNVSKATGEAIAKVPVLSKGPVDEALISVISCLPFGGIAKVAFSFLERAIKGV